MCHLAFSFTTSFYFRQFLKVIRPNFEKKLGGTSFRKKLAGPLLDEVYEEAVEIAEEKLSRATGKITLDAEPRRIRRRRRGQVQLVGHPREGRGRARGGRRQLRQPSPSYAAV